MLSSTELGHLRVAWKTVGLAGTDRECELAILVYGVTVANEGYATLPRMAGWCEFLHGAAGLGLPLDETLRGMVAMSNRVSHLTRFGHRRADEFVAVSSRYLVFLFKGMFLKEVGPLLSSALAGCRLRGVQDCDSELLAPLVASAAIPPPGFPGAEAVWIFLLRRGHAGEIALIVALLELNGSLVIGDATLDEATRDARSYSALIGPYEALPHVNGADLVANAETILSSPKLTKLVAVHDALVDDVMDRNQYLTVPKAESSPLAGLL